VRIEPYLRLAGWSALVIALVAGGVFIGARIWPRVVMVEQRVVAPANGTAVPANGTDAVSDLVERTCPAVVAIAQGASLDPDAAQSGAPASNAIAAAARSQRDAAPGTTGFFISPDGYLVTSAGAIAGQGSLRVLLNDGRSFDATRTGQDMLSGLALLKVDATGLPFLQFADSRFPKVGDRGIALASPNGRGCLAEAGMISVDFVAEQASLWSYIRARPALEPSFAGAPFLNSDGKVVGVAALVQRAADTAAGSPLLPAGTVARITSALMRNENPGANRFGIVADDLLPELAERLGADRQRGAVVSLIRDGSPAALSGLKAGDVILAASDVPISGASELARALDTSDRQISLNILRRARRLTIVVEAH
jgi:S1-C subfamily serine protease